jgi:hypothetical protein
MLSIHRRAATQKLEDKFSIGFPKVCVTKTIVKVTVTANQKKAETTYVLSPLFSSSSFALNSPESRDGYVKV